MPSTISPPQAQVIAFALEGLLHGIAVVLFWLAVIVLTWNRRRRSIDPLLFLGITVVLILCSAHFWLKFSHVYISLMVKGYSVGNEDNILIGADTIVSITDCIGQLVLIYRCWFVWKKRFLVVIVPILMSLASLACAMAGVGILSQIAPTAPIAPPQIVPLGKVALGLPLGTNVLVTGLILGRIWYISRGTVKFLPSKAPQAATIVLIESGALVALAQLTFVVLFVMENPAQDVAVCMAEQIYGIAPTLIIIQVGMGHAIDEASRTQVHTSSSAPEQASVSLRIHKPKGHDHDVELTQYGSESRITKLSF